MNPEGGEEGDLGIITPSAFREECRSDVKNWIRDCLGPEELGQRPLRGEFAPWPCGLDRGLLAEWPALLTPGMLNVWGASATSWHPAVTPLFSQGGHNWALESCGGGEMGPEVSFKGMFSFHSLFLKSHFL